MMNMKNAIKTLGGCWTLASMTGISINTVHSWHSFQKSGTYTARILLCLLIEMKNDGLDLEALLDRAISRLENGGGKPYYEK